MRHPCFSATAIRLSFVACVLLRLAAPAVGQAPAVTAELPPGRALEREMAGAAAHAYVVRLKKDDFFQVRVEQRGIDVLLRLLDASGAELARMDSPNGKQGPETLTFVPKKSGSFTLEVSSTDAKATKGSYVIKREPSRTATVEDRRRVEVERLFVEATQAMTKQDRSDATLTKLEAALKGWQELGDPYLASRTLWMKALALYYQGRKLLNEGKPQPTLAARAKYLEALEALRGLYTRLTDQPLSVSLSQSERADWQAAVKAYEGLTLDNLAITHHLAKEWQESVNYRKLALAVLGEMRANAEIRASQFFSETSTSFKLTEASDLGSIASTLSSVLNNARESLDYFNRAIAACEEIQKDETYGSQARLQAAVALEGMAQAYLMLDDRPKAIETFERSRSAYRTVPGQQSQEASLLLQIGNVYSSQLDYEKALQNFQEAATIAESSDNKHDRMMILGLIGTTYTFLGKEEEARGYYQQALAILLSPDYLESVRKHRGINGPQSSPAEAKGVDLSSFVKASDEYAQLSAIGLIYQLLGKSEKSLEYFEKALPAAHSTQSQTALRQALSLIGTAYVRLKNWPKAREYYGQVLDLSRQGQQKSDLASDLIDVGYAHLESGNPQEAVRHLNEALLVYQSLGVNDDNILYGNYSTALSHLARAWEALGNRRLAIFYGKQAVNGLQNERQKIHRQKLQMADLDIQRSYLKKNEKPYRRLADWLIADGRIAEAEQVLAMLKEDEYFNYLRRDASEADKLQQRADLTQDEREALTHYNEIADRIAALGREFAELQELLAKNGRLTDEQQRRYDELDAQTKAANHIFQAFLKQLADEFARRTNLTADLQENLALKSDLKHWGAGVVFLYTLVGDDRYRVILTTPHAQTDGKTEIKADKLNAKITAFRAAVQNPAIDPRPLGKELYDILIKPIEKQLDGAKAKTLLWSLDGNLRLLPLAALWDGKQYFGQKYQNVMVTLASRTRLGTAVAPSWRVLGLGVSQPQTIKEPNGTRDLSFKALPAVKTELASIVQSEKSPNGILPGQILLDAEFTEAELKKALLKHYGVIHIASHFSLNAGDSTKSFLLMGDGTALTVSEIKTSEALLFDDVELLTLSACETAVVEKDGSGKEIEGFGYVAQQKGAKAILATLWSVVDESTQLLMSEFYRLRKKNPRLTKAEAMQLAQRALLRGAYKTDDAPSWRRGPVQAAGADKSPSFVRDANAPYAHPCFWSPFVLIGNWR